MSIKKFLNTSFEFNLLEKSYDIVVGIDEVGRGPWAGPMYMCAYVITPDYIQRNGIRDSKSTTQTHRNTVFSEIKNSNYFLEICSVETINELNLGGAINKCFQNLINQVLSKYKNKNVKFLVDGYFKGDWDHNFEFINKGDSKIYSIAAASIVAKVERDKEMKNLAKKFPGYGFEKNVGYGTKEHREGLEKLGICDIHRKSFKPIKKFL